MQTKKTEEVVGCIIDQTAARLLQEACNAEEENGKMQQKRKKR
jgi:hypothetical protein